jgi:hypothetical protein
MDKLNSSNYGMTIMFLATTLCEKYEEWKDDSNLNKIIKLDENSICIELKKMYPMISDKVRKSMSLAFSLYIYLLLSDSMPNIEQLD